VRLLLAAALGLVAAVAPKGSTAPPVETLYTRPAGPIVAFAQDGPLISWFEPGGTRCNRVRVRSLANGLTDSLPLQGSARNVTCHWNVAQPVRLAVARDLAKAIWTLPERGPLAFDSLIGAAVNDERERRYHEIAHTARGAGLWLAGIAGDGPTLVYAVTSVEYEDEAGCLAGTGTCEMKISGGGVYRVVGRQEPKQVPGTGGTAEVAVSGSNVAWVPAAPFGKTVALTTAADIPISVVDVKTGSIVARVVPEGAPIAIALTDRLLLALERVSKTTMRLAWYETASGKPNGSVEVPVATSPELTANGRFAIFRTGRVVRSVDLQTEKVKTVVKTASTPIGLSLEGSRLAWAENVAGTGRIRAATLPR
jgi:hypothetical protein